MTETTFDGFATWLLAEHRRGARFRPMAQDHFIDTLDTAYVAQAAVVRALQAEGLGEIAGWKIGLTSARMQAMCGIDQPLAGAVLASRVQGSGARLDRMAFGRLGLEFEICVRIGSDLPARTDPYTRAEVTAAAERRPAPRPVPPAQSRPRLRQQLPRPQPQCRAACGFAQWPRALGVSPPQRELRGLETARPSCAPDPDRYA